MTEHSIRVADDGPSDDAAVFIVWFICAIVQRKGLLQVYPELTG